MNIFKHINNKAIYKKLFNEDNVVTFVQKIILNKTKIGITGSVVCVALFIICISVNTILKNISFSDKSLINLANLPIASTTKRNSVIAIPQGMVKANPFLPYKELSKKNNLDVPESALVEPPETVNENSEAARVMDTMVSGILYDKYSPSAILNIEGTDYLVKKGDVVNNYKVLSILKDSVTVQLGVNTYKAGIGEILTEGTVNKNNISNLNKKFGGRRQ